MLHEELPTVSRQWRWSPQGRLFVRLCAIVSGVTVALLGIFGTVLVTHVERSVYAEASENLLDKSRTIRGMLLATHELMKVAVDKLFAVFEHNFNGEWALDPGPHVRLGEHHAAALTLAGRPIRPHAAVVDEFTRSSGGHVATIFVRHGDHFLRLTTSLRDAGGERAVGTALDRDHPGYGKLLNGESYVGYARLFDRPYMTKYRPITDRSGRVIGALFVGLDLADSFAQIRQQIAKVRVGRTGYVYVLDSTPGASRGRLLIHPRFEGQSVLAVTPPEERAFFERVLAAPEGRVDVYRFSNADNEPLRDKIAAFAEFPEWRWIIGAGAFVDEFAAQQQGLKLAVAGAMLLAGLSIVVVMSILLRRSVVGPLLARHEQVCADEQRARHTAQHDALTGLPNRTLLDDRLQQALHQAERHGREVGILFIDLDHFKEVNDTLGHAAGDQLLREAAQRFTRCVRLADTVARVGGDEFVVVVTDAADAAAVFAVAEKLIAAFTDAFIVGGTPVSVSPSIGISRYPADGHAPVALLRLADEAMYAAKAAGRNTFRHIGATGQPTTVAAPANSPATPGDFADLSTANDSARRR